MGGNNNNNHLHFHETTIGGGGHQQQPSPSPKPKLEQVIELEDESGDASDTFLTLESLLDHDINLDEPLPLLPSTYGDTSFAEPIPATSSVTADCATTQQQQQQLPPDNNNTATSTTVRDPNLVIVPHHHDVLLGRGGRNNQWSGNECLRQLARVMAVAYGSAHKRDKPALAWRLIQQVRSLDPPGRFLKQKVAAGDWFEVSDDIAREKASQCLRDIVAASRSSFDGSRKRAYQSAPELNAKRMRVSMPSGVLSGATATANSGSMQNATFGQPILTPLIPTSMNPSLATSASTTSVARSMPPKAVSCMTLGAPNASTNNMTAAGSNPNTPYNDRLLQQLQLVRAQTQQQQQFLAASADATANSQRNLLQSMSSSSSSNMNTSNSFVSNNNGGAARSVSFAASTTNASFPAQLQAAYPSQSGISSGGIASNSTVRSGGMVNSGWNTTNSTANGNWSRTNSSSSNAAMLMSTDNLQQQQSSMLGWQQQQQPQSSGNGTNATWGATTNAAWGGTQTLQRQQQQQQQSMSIPTITPSATVMAGTGNNNNNSEDALKRWIDRMTTTTGHAADNNNGGGGL